MLLTSLNSLSIFGQLLCLYGKSYRLVCVFVRRLAWSPWCSAHWLHRPYLVVESAVHTCTRATKRILFQWKVSIILFVVDKTLAWIPSVAEFANATAHSQLTWKWQKLQLAVDYERIWNVHMIVKVWMMRVGWQNWPPQIIYIICRPGSVME